MQAVATHGPGIARAAARGVYSLSGARLAVARGPELARHASEAFHLPEAIDAAARSLAVARAALARMRDAAGLEGEALYARVEEALARAAVGALGASSDDGIGEATIA